MAAKKDVVELEMSVDQALKFVISIGVVQPDMKVFLNKAAINPP
jgi:uncharacterized membrane protein